MANVRKAGARMLARLAAGLCLVFPLASFADDGTAPFAEYSGDDRWSALPADAAGWQMTANCAWEGYVGCTITSVTTISTGYAYRYYYTANRPGGPERVERDGFGTGAWSCPVGFGVYTEFMGMEVGPYPNRMLDLGSGYPIRCKPMALAMSTQEGATSLDHPGFVETFDQGRLAEHRREGSDPMTWSVTWDSSGVDVTGHGEPGVVLARIERGRVVSLGLGMRLEYDDKGSLEAVQGPGGSVFSRALVKDPEGRLVGALRVARHRLPVGPASEPLATLARLGDSIDALLDGRSTGLSIDTPP